MSQPGASIPDTSAQYDAVMAQCRELFRLKLQDYGPTWRVLRPEGLTDQLFIKVNRIRNIEEKGVRLVDEGVGPEYVGIINYSIIALIQMGLGASNDVDLTNVSALAKYDQIAEQAKQLMLRKNHDYGEAWRDMRMKGLTDLILVKILRNRQIESNQNRTEVSEGVDANLYDMVNYAVFALIRSGSCQSGRDT